MNKTIRNALKLCGVPQDVHGFMCLSYAIECAVNDCTYLWDITKRLYPAVAEKFNITPMAAERVMRYAIERSIKNMPYDVMKQIFGNTINDSNGRPTVSQFIAAVSDYVQD